MRLRGSEWIWVTIICGYGLTKFGGFCQPDEANSLFKMNSDEKEVEQLVADYIEWKKKSAKLTLKIGFRKKKIVNMCKLADPVKLHICAITSRINYFGLVLALQNYPGPNCDHYDVNVPQLSQADGQSNLLFMYKCPPVQFRDLESDEIITLPIAYFVSSAHLPKSFFTFLREGSNFPIYPHGFAFEVDFARLKLAPFQPAEMSSRHIFEKSVSANIGMAERDLWKIVRTKLLRKPYEKFSLTLNIENVCGLPRDHKICLCRDLVRYDFASYRIDYEGYDETGCQKRFVTTYTMPFSSAEIATVKCPPPYEKFGDIKRYSLRSLFVSTSSMPKSILILERMNLKNSNMAVKFLASYSNLDVLETDRRRKKELLKPQHFAEITEALRLSREMAELAKQFYYKQISINFNRAIVEDHTIAFANAISMKKPYEHFKLTVSTINVSGLPRNLMELLCHQIFHSSDYNLSFQSNMFLYHDYDKIVNTNIKLVMRDAEKLAVDILRNRPCPPVYQHPFEYTLSGSLEAGTLIAYAKYYEQYAIPDALVSQVDIQYLRTTRLNHHLLADLLLNPFQQRSLISD